MNFFNCHTHTDNSHDCPTPLEDMYRAAVNAGLTGFAVTDHCDCEYADNKEMVNDILNSFDEAEKLKKSCADSMIISCGVEMGEMLTDTAFSKKMIAARNWDMILCSVHAVSIPEFEMPFSMIDFSDKTDSFIDIYISKYFEELYENAMHSDYDVLCHLTVILRYVVYKYKKTVDITKYYPIIEDILKAVISRDKSLEVNTSGIHDNYFMPDRDILMMYKNLGGKKISIGSDAHVPQNISAGLSEAAELLKSIGFDTLTYYIERKCHSYTI